MPTERECVERERKAFEIGWTEAVLNANRESSGVMYATARQTYPLPTVTRPRVVKDPGGRSPWVYPGEWRCVDGQMEWRGGKDEEWSRAVVAPTPERIAVWSDLLANPTEEVEA